MNSIQDIKKSIGNLNISNQVHIQPSANMDDEMRTFLDHHFSNAKDF